jgi:galactokinase
MMELAEQSFSKKGEYTHQAIMTEFKTEDPFKLVSNVSHVNEVKSKNASFELYKRAFHVLSEAKRVLDFKDTCNDETLDEETKVTKLGELMTQSHISCDQYYDCSSRELNELTTLARDSGALGSRLTGAGWGGCCVSLVRKANLEDFIDKVYTYWTKERPVGEQLWITDDLDRYIFATQPAQGACVIDP